MHPLNIIKQPEPTNRPFFVGRMPSMSGGRVLDFASGFTPDGAERQVTTDRGAVKDSGDNFFYLCVFGGTISMSESDMHECVEEMVQTRQEKAKQREIAITGDQIKQKVADFIDAVNDAKVGRRRF